MFGPIARASAAASPYGRREAGRERAEAVAVLRLGGEADDGDRAAVEVAVADDDLGPPVGNALDLVAPLARGLERGLHRLGAAVHRQRAVQAGQLASGARRNPAAGRCGRRAR